MNNTKITFRLLSAIVLFSMAAFVISCSQDETPTGFSDSQSVSSEASSDSFFEDGEDLSATAVLADDADIRGRGDGLKQRDPRFSCATITLKNKIQLNADQSINKDTIIIDFGMGCDDKKGNIRKGKIIIYFSGNRRLLTSVIVTTFDGFSVNDVKMEGTRTVTLKEVSLTSITHEVKFEGGKISWPDNTTATRVAHHFRKVVHNATLTNRTDDQVILLVGGTASGSNRNGKEYTMQISKDIVFKASCFEVKKFMPVSGEKMLETAGKQIVINFGNGDCDNMVTVTVDGVSREVTIDRG